MYIAHVAYISIACSCRLQDSGKKGPSLAHFSAACTHFTVLVPFFHSTTLTKSLAQANASIITIKVYRDIDAVCNKYSLLHEFNIRPANVLLYSQEKTAKRLEFKTLLEMLGKK